MTAEMENIYAPDGSALGRSLPLFVDQRNSNAFCIRFRFRSPPPPPHLLRHGRLPFPALIYDCALANFRFLRRVDGFLCME